MQCSVMSNPWKPCGPESLEDGSLSTGYRGASQCRYNLSSHPVPKSCHGIIQSSRTLSLISAIAAGCSSSSRVVSLAQRKKLRGYHVSDCVELCRVHPSLSRVQCTQKASSQAEKLVYLRLHRKWNCRHHVKSNTTCATCSLFVDREHVEKTVSFVSCAFDQDTGPQWILPHPPRRFSGGEPKQAQQRKVKLKETQKWKHFIELDSTWHDASWNQA